MWHNWNKKSHNTSKKSSQTTLTGITTMTEANNTQIRSIISIRTSPLDHHDNNIRQKMHT